MAEKIIFSPKVLYFWKVNCEGNQNLMLYNVLTKVFRY